MLCVCIGRLVDAVLHAFYGCIQVDLDSIPPAVPRLQFSSEWRSCFFISGYKFSSFTILVGIGLQRRHNRFQFLDCGIKNPDCARRQFPRIGEIIHVIE